MERRGRGGGGFGQNSSFFLKSLLSGLRGLEIESGFFPGGQNGNRKYFQFSELKQENFRFREWKRENFRLREWKRENFQFQFFPELSTFRKNFRIISLPKKEFFRNNGNPIYPLPITVKVVKMKIKFVREPA